LSWPEVTLVTLRHYPTWALEGNTVDELTQMRPAQASAWVALVVTPISLLVCLVRSSFWPMRRSGGPGDADGAGDADGGEGDKEPPA